MHSVITSNLETTRENIIQFKKDSWHHDCNVLLISNITIKEYHTIFQYFTNLKELSLYGDIIIIENQFDTLKNLTSLKLKFLSDQIPKFLFKNLKKLKELSLEFYIKGLNQNHLCGLDNLESLKLVSNFNGQIDNLANLKTLTLQGFNLEDFSFKNFKNLETLCLDEPFVNISPKDSLSCLTSLKNFTFYDYRVFYEGRVDERYCLFSNLPDNIEHFECRDFTFDIFHKRGAPFIYKLKSLVIIINSESGFKNNYLFQENLFPCLESIDLKERTGNSQSISIELFKKIKKLKALKLERSLSLVGIDKEFNYLEEASFDYKIPENILNFSNLKKLTLKDFYPDEIEIGEDFLENLIHLEELVLERVAYSIDSNAQYLFKTLIKLKELKLTSLSFCNFKSTYFDYLVNLEKLDLQKCHFKDVEEGPFRNLKKLNYLNLSNCKSYGDKPLDKLFFVGILNLKTLEMNFDSKSIYDRNIEFKKDSFTDLKSLTNISFRKRYLEPFRNIFSIPI